MNQYAELITELRELIDLHSYAYDVVNRAADALQAESAAVPESTAEQFIQAAIDNAPEPLRRLGEYLSRVLDEDQWGTAEQMLLAIASKDVAIPDIEGVAEARAIAIYEAVHNEVASRTPWTHLPPREWEMWRRAANVTQPPSAKPLTITTIVMMSMDYQITGSTYEIVRFAHAIEAKHNIKEPTK